MPTMLILRGNSGEYQDEDGHAHNYTKGALHEEPAKVTCSSSRWFRKSELKVRDKIGLRAYSSKRGLSPSPLNLESKL